MFKSIKTKSFLLAAIAAVALTGFAPALSAQITLSPYSRYGLGDIFSPSSTRNFAMGSVGIGSFDGTTINRVNPASYADLRMTTLDYSGFGQYTRQKSNSAEGAFGSAGFHNVSLGFANKKGFGIVAGLAPYSSVGYNVILQDSIFADTAFKPYSTTYTSDGGLTQFYIGAGVRVLRHFNVGVNLNYLFGTTNTRTTTDFTDNVFVPVNIHERASLSGLQPQFGLQYGDTLRIRKELQRADEIQGEIKDLENELLSLDKEESEAKADKDKLAEWNGKMDAEIKEIDNEKAGLDTQLKGLMTDEIGNEKAIQKIQEKMFRLEKKRKAIQRDTKARNRESDELLSRISGRRQRITDRIAALNRELEEVKQGRKQATVIKRQNYIFRVGGVVETGGALKGELLSTFDNSSIIDTLRTVEGQVSVPLKFGGGISIVRPGRWSLGIDASYQDWGTFEYFGTNPGLGAALNFNGGGEWIPDLLSRNFGKRTAYRAGLYHHGAYMTLSGQPIVENGFTFGVGLPIGFISATGQNYSRINIGVSVGRRGTTEGNLLEETTFHFRVGINLNDIWFIKRRID